MSAVEPHVVEDCRGVLQLMSDGTRRPALPVDVRTTTAAWSGRT
jgi:hypothetical protein